MPKVRARALYADLYCAPGEIKNRIKEQLSLFADRVRTETMRANQMRVYLSGLAYVLVSALRRVGLQGPEMTRAQAKTIRFSETGKSTPVTAVRT